MEEPKMKVKLLRIVPHSYPQSIIIIRLQNKELKWAKNFDGVVSIKEESNWSYYKIEVPDVNILACPKSSEALLLSYFSSYVPRLLLHESKEAAEKMAEISVENMKESQESGFTGVGLEFGIEVGDLSKEEDYWDEIWKTVSQERESPSEEGGAKELGMVIGSVRIGLEPEEERVGLDLPFEEPGPNAA